MPERTLFAAGHIPPAGQVEDWEGLEAELQRLIAAQAETQRDLARELRRLRVQLAIGG